MPPAASGNIPSLEGLGVASPLLGRGGRGGALMENWLCQFFPFFVVHGEFGESGQLAENRDTYYNNIGVTMVDTS